MQNLPDKPAGETNFGFDYIPEPINILLDVKDRQRRGKGDP